MASKWMVLYKPFVGTESHFCDKFNNDDTKYQMAQSFWNTMDSHLIWFGLLCIVVSLICSLWYYGPYNNEAGRHYKHSHWLVFFVVNLIAEFAGTFCLAKFYLCKSALKEASSIYLDLGIANLFWGFILFMLVSAVYSWVCPTKTNANPLL